MCALPESECKMLNWAPTPSCQILQRCIHQPGPAGPDAVHMASSGFTLISAALMALLTASAQHKHGSVDGALHFPGLLRSDVPLVDTLDGPFVVLYALDDARHSQELPIPWECCSWCSAQNADIQHQIHASATLMPSTGESS